MNSIFINYLEIKKEKRKKEKKKNEEIKK